MIHHRPRPGTPLGPRPLFATSLVLALLALLLSFGMGASAKPKADPHCNGQQAEKKGECEPDASSVVVTDVTVTTGNGGGNGGGNDDGNPDCNENGPERACGEEDGDHNQGGACDGNEGNRKQTCETPGPTPSPTPGPTPTPGTSPTPEPEGSIALAKSGPDQVNVGDPFDYTLTVTNTGGVPLDAVSLVDAMLGIDIDLPDLPAGGSATVTIASLAPLTADTVVNTAEACGSAASEVCDTDDHTLLVIDPGISMTKTASPDSVNPGQTVTYTYVVTNTGSTALSDITVTDDVLGDIGSVASLAPGESVTFTKDFLVAADSPTTNIATVCGTDTLGQENCDVAVEEITLVLPAGPQGRGGPLPTTGFPLLVWIASGVTWIAGGLAMVDIRRRRRASEEM